MANKANKTIYSVPFILLQLFSFACCATNTTMLDLHHHLFKNYVKDLRPVIHTKTATNITYRMIIRSLLALETREQTFTVATELKTSWTDEFLKWDPNEYGGIKRFNAPITSIWIPDIVLRDNVDNEKTKPNMRAQIFSDGTIIWFAQVIYTALCKVKVRWFPFDTQVCDMIFESWTYRWIEINLEPEISEDNRYVANGVWDMVAVREKGVLFAYPCCPDLPYAEVRYRLIFKRHATFYISYMVLPCLFLSILSLLVFHLPPDCGEKLTLSITNLLALVVFQQIIAQNMPPSSDNAPVIGTYFMCMISMVCCSVISTGVVVHLSAISQPMPKWVKRIFLEIIPRFLCLSTFSFQHHAQETDIENKTIFKNHYTNDRAIRQNGMIDANEDNEDSVRRETKAFIEVVPELLKYIKEDIDIKNGESAEHLQWQRVSIIIDRMLLYIFSLFTVICSLYLGVRIVHGSVEEYNDILKELEEDWPLLKQSCCVKNATMLDLHHHLFNNYMKDVRPVIDTKTATNVTYRMFIRSLLALETREQTFRVGTELKTTWTDEFMKWDPDEYGGITHFNAPNTAIWTPDIVLRDSADSEVTKPNTRAQIYSDGTIIWFAQVIYTALCNVKVRWFPFDTQVCDMIFLSWSYDGFEINLEPGKSADNRYIANGVWDMVAVRQKGRIFTFACCPEPYTEIHYRLVFKRHATFYIFYMVLPCVFLSILSLLVFYLPPDCGEKLTLSITNLLALVVFQQIIAENMPPSSDDSPVIGTYFTCMISMVCLSVISTGIVMHLSAISQPMPKWVKRILLEKLPRVLCVSFQIHAEGADMANKSIFEIHHTNKNGMVDVKEENDDSAGRETKTFNEMVELLKYIKEDINIKNDENAEHLQWQCVSIIIDRMLLYLFSVFTIICTLYLAILTVHGSVEDYNDILKELEEDWPLLI
ncbi:uncharacterized protein [Amphiura filiformis]|uniref:uncharacterized protein n=1 Tax=Amphiura filiformis TaxID=82378 RepID=UPI003B217F4D